MSRFYYINFFYCVFRIGQSESSKRNNEVKRSQGVQSDQKENKSEQALQIIGHVVAEFYVNKRSMQFVVSNATL
jgi:hypothetical protein